MAATLESSGEQGNSGKILEAWLRRDSFAFHALVGLACAEILAFLGPPARPFDNSTRDLILLVESERHGQF